MKTRKAPPIQPLKTNSPPPAFLAFVVGLALMLVLALGGAGSSLAGAPPEVIGTIETDDPFEAFRASRMALPETTPPINPVAGGDASLTGPVTPQQLFREEQADLNGDGRGETYSLRNGHLTITDPEDRLLWQSPEEWWIDDFFLGDITNDGRQNLCLSVWKEGSYGPYRPFWVEANDSLVRNHLFVYQMETGGEQAPEKPSVKAVWQSSHLARPNHRAFIAPIDGENHLVVVQGDYEDPQAGEIAFWKWNGWGFSPAEIVEKACEK